MSSYKWTDVNQVIVYGTPITGEVITTHDGQTWMDMRWSAEYGETTGFVNTDDMTLIPDDVLTVSDMFAVRTAVSTAIQDYEIAITKGMPNHEFHVARLNALKIVYAKIRLNSGREFVAKAF